MDHYFYDGPVMEFGRCIADRWKGETMAVSEKQARSNLTYKFKINTGRTPSSKVVLSGKIRKENSNGN